MEAGIHNDIPGDSWTE